MAPVASLTGTRRALAPKADQQSILDFIAEYVRVAPIEVQTAFDLTEAKAKEIIDKLTANFTFRFRSRTPKRPPSTRRQSNRVTSFLTAVPGSQLQRR